MDKESLIRNHLDGSKNDWFIFAGAFFGGAAAILGLVALLREALIIVGGNESSIGPGLGIWLLFFGLSSAIFAKWKAPGTLLYVIPTILTPVAYLISLYFISSIRGWMGAGFGEIVSVYPILLYLLLAIAPISIISGAGFGALSQNRNSECSFDVYIAGGFGAAVAGFIYWLILFAALNSLELIFAIATASFISVAICIFSASANKWILSIGLILLLCFSAILLAKFDIVEDVYGNKVYTGNKIIVADATRIGSLAVLEKDDKLFIYSNGQLIVSEPNLKTVEETIHFPLAAHSSPKRVAIIGNGHINEIEEVRKHATVEEITLVQPDANLYHLIGETLDRGKSETFDSRDIDVASANVVFEDPRRWVKRQARSAEKYDVIIIETPNPISLSTNRYYTVDFLGDIKKIIEPDGIVGFLIENVSVGNLADVAFLNLVNATANEQFDDVVMLPTGAITVLCSDTPIEGYYTSFYDDEFGRRKLDTKHYRGATILSDYSEDADDVAKSIGSNAVSPNEGRIRITTSLPGNIKTLLTDKAISSLAVSLDDNGLVNSDMNPSAFYIAELLSADDTNSVGDSYLKIVYHLRLWHFLLVAALLFGIWLLVRKRNEKWTGYAVKLALICQGSAGVSLLVLLLLGFSTIYASSFSGFTLIFAAFVLGASSGALWAKLRGINDFRQAINDVLGLTIVAAFAIVIAVFALGRRVDIIPIMIGYAAFLILATSTGFLSGSQLPFAARYFISGKQSEKYTTYRHLFGVGLIGSGAGAIAFSIVIVPVLGIAQSALVSVMILSTAILLISTTSKRKQKETA